MATNKQIMDKLNSVQGIAEKTYNKLFVSEDGPSLMEDHRAVKKAISDHLSKHPQVSLLKDWKMILMIVVTAVSLLSALLKPSADSEKIEKIEKILKSIKIP